MPYVGNYLQRLDCLVLRRIDALQERHDALVAKLETEDHGAFEPAGAAIHAGIEEAAELTKMQAYLGWVSALNKISAELEELVSGGDGHGGAPADDLRLKLRDLASLVQQLEGSQCTNLLARAAECLAGWRYRLTDKLRVEFLEVAGQLGIPYTSFEAAQKAATEDQKDNAQLWRQFEHLLEQLLNYEGVEKPGQHHVADPLRALFAPLFVRFATYFESGGLSGSSKVKKSDIKPGFMFRTVREWIDCNRGLVSERLGKFMLRTGHKSINPYLELIKGFAVLLRVKLAADFDSLGASDEDATLLCVAVREMLSFDRATLELYGFADSAVTVSSVVTNDDFLCERWLDTEYRIIGETLDEVCPCLRTDVDHPFDEPTQWEPAFGAALGDGANLAGRNAPNSAQGVVTVFESIAALVKQIPDVTLQERVVSKNQLRMLAYYRTTLEEVAEIALTTISDREVVTTVKRHTGNQASKSGLHVRSTLQSVQNVAGKAVKSVIVGARTSAAATAAAMRRLCAVANALWFVRRALVAWDDDMLYVELDSVVIPSGGDDDGGSGAMSSAAAYGQVLGPEIAAYTTLLSKVTAVLAKETCAGITERCVDDYVEELGQAAAAASATDVPDLSAHLSLVCSSMEPLLQTASDALEPEIVSGVWTHIARIADETFFDAVLHSSGFTEGMAAQLEHDMLFGLFRLFVRLSENEPGSTSTPANRFKEIVETKSSNLFSRMSEACKLLTLDEGTWSRMNGLLSMEGLLATDQIGELQKLGVFQLSREDATDIVKLRIDKLSTANPGT